MHGSVGPKLERVRFDLPWKGFGDWIFSPLLYFLPSVVFGQERIRLDIEKRGFGWKMRRWLGFGPSFVPCLGISWAINKHSQLGVLEPIIHHIFSFLEINDIARIGAVSKRFRQILSVDVPLILCKQFRRDLNI
jgi:hypothetical protein